MANSYTGLFTSLAASFNELSAMPDKRNPFITYGTTDVSPEKGQLGQVIYTNIVANAGEAQNLPTGSSLTFDDVVLNPNPVTLNQHLTYGVPLPNLDRAIGLSDSIIRQLRDTGVQKIANGMNKYVASLITAANFNVNTPIASGAEDNIPDSAVAAAWLALASRDVPVDDYGNMFMITDPTVYSNLLQNDSWRKFDNIGPMATNIRQTALLGTQWGAFVDFDNGLTATSGVHKALFFHKYALASAVRAVPASLEGGVNTSYVYYKGVPIRVTISYDGRMATDLMTFDVLFGAAVVRPDFGVLITTS